MNQVVPFSPDPWEKIESLQNGLAHQLRRHDAGAKTLPADEILHQVVSELVATNGHGGGQTPPPETIEEAIEQQNMTAVLSMSEQCALLPALELARLKVRLRQTFATGFPMREFEELIREERARIEREREQAFTVKSLPDLMKKTFSPVDWVVPGIIPIGLVVLAGRQKIGKSWLDHNLCIAIATGGKMFGSISVQEGDVLYLALEDNERRLQDRFGQAMALLAPGSAVPSRIDYMESWPRMNEVGVLKLEEWILSKHNPRLIIIDPWVKVKPRVKFRAGETGYDAEYEALEGIKQVADKYNICILIQMHLRKADASDPMDEINATSGVSSCADGTLILKRPRGEKVGTLWGTGRDYQEEVSLAVSFEDGFWRIIGEAVDSTRPRLSAASREVLEVLWQQEKPMKPKQIATLLLKEENVIRYRLFAMKNREEVRETEEGYIPLIPNDRYITESKKEEI